MTYIKNASGTSRWPRPSTGEASWPEYWEKQTGKKTTRCGVTDCHSASNLVGAHVQKMFGGNELYITPLYELQPTLGELLGRHRTGESTKRTVSMSHHGMQRLKCTVAESEGHRIVANLNCFTYGKFYTRNN